MKTKILYFLALALIFVSFSDAATYSVDPEYRPNSEYSNNSYIEMKMDGSKMGLEEDVVIVAGANTVMKTGKLQQGDKMPLEMSSKQDTLFTNSPLFSQMLEQYKTGGSTTKGTISKKGDISTDVKIMGNLVGTSSNSFAESFRGKKFEIGKIEKVNYGFEMPSSKQSIIIDLDTKLDKVSNDIAFFSFSGKMKESSPGSEMFNLSLKGSLKYDMKNKLYSYINTDAKSIAKNEAMSDMNIIFTFNQKKTK
ncbi:MAG: hypothetical protein Kapaf2KO_01420 [Candidatus Kapaibacteriales bacterium]